MSDREFKRKLTAILSADVEGYSRLMSLDEADTVSTLKSYREKISRSVLSHYGRVVDSPGDNIRAEFVSAVDAVKCALEVQDEIKICNTSLPNDRKMVFRIGINLGDVIVDGDRIYGDGVNIAARLEGLATGGGICISGNTYEQIQNKVPVGCEFIGKQSIKNITNPVPAYKIWHDPDATACTVNIAGERKSKKTVLTVATVVVILLIGVAAFIKYSPTSTSHPPSDDVARPLENLSPAKPSIAVHPLPT